MIQAKAPFECALAILRACKQAFRSFNRVTLFIFDSTLQQIILSGQRQL
jgi:hypothetical protein